MNRVLSIFVAGLVSVAVGEIGSFTFLDQDAWSMLPNSQCGGRRQSPIDLYAT